MKRASDEPTTSTGKRARSRLFTVQQVMQTLADSDSDEAEFDQDYALSSDTDTESEQFSASNNEDRPRSSGSGSTTSRSRSRRGVSHKQRIQGMVLWMTVGVETL